MRRRFEREAKTLAALSHPHICPVFDVGQQDGVDFLVMEYLEGETLAARLIGGPLPLDLAIRHALEIADALDKAHRKGIVLHEASGVRLVRVPLAGGPEPLITLPRGLRLSPTPLAGRAVRDDGRIAVRIAPLDSWFRPAAVFDPATGRVQRIPGDQVDMPNPAWSKDGRLVTNAQAAQGVLWRFRREDKGR